MQLDAASTIPLLQLKGMTKRFSSTLIANDKVDFDLCAGEIHALLGENGAGKSTLMQILYGLYRSDEGEVRIAGRPVEISSPQDAISHGIGMIHQEFMLVECFTVAENLLMGTVPLPGGKSYSVRQAAEQISALSKEFGLDVDANTKIEDLSIGERQRVEILKLLFRDAKIMILDEPTAVLTPGEVERLFVVLRRLAAAGRSIIIVTHKLHEVLSLTDRVTVLRAGKKTGTVATRDATADDLVRMMVGRAVVLSADVPLKKPGRPALVVRRVALDDALGVRRLHEIDLDVHAGEILGIAGVDGNGQSELAEALFGLRQVAAGGISLKDEDLTNRSPADFRRSGVAYVPGDRRQVGSLPGLSIQENVMLGDTERFVRPFGYLDRAAAAGRAQSLIDRFGVRTSSQKFLAGKLSGGNLQKVILGREVMREPDVLIVEQPTRGLDIGAVKAIWDELLAQRQRGCAILLISAELEEIFNLSDRIAVMYGGRILNIFNRDEADLEKVGALMAGESNKPDSSEGKLQ